MSSERTIRIGIVVAVLLIGLIIGRRAFTEPGHGTAAPFRQWFWENRTLDLMVQVGLVFVGALAIAALLPSDKGT